MSLKSLILSDVSDVFLDTDEFADVCLYVGDGFNGSPALIANYADPNKPLRGDVLTLDGISALGVDFRGSVADFTVDVPTTVPLAGDEITWTDAQNQPRTFVVFPRVAGRCFDLSPDRAMLRIYTVADEDLARATYKTPEGSEFEWKVLPGQTRGGESYDESTDTVKTIRASLYGSRRDLRAAGVNDLQRNARITIDEITWAIELQESHFGAELVRLGLVRKLITRHQEMESHGAV